MFVGGVVIVVVVVVVIDDEDSCKQKFAFIIRTENNSEIEL